MPPVLSKEKEKYNCVRMNIAILDVGTKCVRKVFDKEFAEQNLEKELRKHFCKLSKTLTLKQMTIIRRTGVRSVDFDMTLMMVLLNDIAELDISDKLPVKSNTKEADDLSRLKWYRNMICHSPDFEIDDKTFENISEEILQVVVRIGDQGLEKELRKILTGNIEFLINHMKYTLLQWLIILHANGYDMCSKVSEKFWTFSASYQLLLLMSLFEFHFWEYPPMYVLWDEFQDSFHEKSDNEFYEKGESQPDKHDMEDGNSYQRSATKATKTLHTVKIACKAICKTGIIAIVCTCRDGKVAGELCYERLFTMLDPSRYKHDQNPTDDTIDYHLVYGLTDGNGWNYDSYETKVTKGKEKLSTARISCENGIETMSLFKEIEVIEQMNYQQNTWITQNISIGNATDIYYNDLSSTGHGICKNLCDGQKQLC